MINHSLYILLLLVSFVSASEEKKKTVDYGSPLFWGNIVAIITLVVISGIVAGLTLGLMSLDDTNLTILSVAGTEKQKKHAASIIPIRKNKHLLLTALVLTNTVVNETLPVVLNGIFGEGYIAVITSTVLLVIFSEIVPQAICTRHGMAIGALFSIPIRILIMIWYIIAWPISKTLDLMLGDREPLIYRVQELYELVRMHDKAVTPTGSLNNQTASIIYKTLELQSKTIKDISKPISDVFMLDRNTLLNKPTLQQILEKGYSRVPVYENPSSEHDDVMHIKLEADKKTIIGCLDTKWLSSIDPNQGLSIMDLSLEPVVHVPTSLSTIEVLEILREKQSQMAVVHQSQTASTRHETIVFMESEACQRSEHMLEVSSLPLKQETISFLSRFKRVIGISRSKQNSHDCGSSKTESITPPNSQTSANDTFLALDISASSSMVSSTENIDFVGIVTILDIVDQILPVSISTGQERMSLEIQSKTTCTVSPTPTKV